MQNRGHKRQLHYEKYLVHTFRGNFLHLVRGSAVIPTKIPRNKSNSMGFSWEFMVK